MRSPTCRRYSRAKKLEPNSLEPATTGADDDGTDDDSGAADAAGRVNRASPVRRGLLGEGGDGRGMMSAVEGGAGASLLGRNAGRLARLSEPSLRLDGTGSERMRARAILNLSSILL